ncbi:MAG: universal stress protein [Trebonia sp.]
MSDSHGDALWRRSPSRRRQINDRDGGHGTIVVGVGGSQTSLRALAFAIGLARRQGAELVCVHIPALRGMFIPAQGDVAFLADAARMHTREQIEQSIRREVGADLREWDVQGRFVVGRGSWRAALRKAARQTSADAIIISAPTGLTRYLFALLPVSLIRGTRCPVIIVP